MKRKRFLLVFFGIILCSGWTLAPVPGEVIPPGQFPPEPGEDAFPVSLAQIAIDLTLDGIPEGEISAEGPFLVVRGAPHRGTDGRNVIDTEILQMDLTGSSPLGPVTIRTSPTRPSTGRIIGRDMEQDFPADSFFDIFVEIEIGELVLHNPEPIRMEAVITGIPPKITVYRTFQQPVIPLLTSQQQIAALLLHVAHAPNPDLPIFPEDLKVLVERVQLQLELVNKKIELLNRNLPVGLRSHLLFPFNVSVPGVLETGIAISNITAHFASQGLGETSRGPCDFRLFPQSDPQHPVLINSTELVLQGLGQGLDAQGAVPPGGTLSILVGELLQGAGRSGPFVGQVTAWCDFPQAQGINFIGDSNFATQSQGYPAVIIK